MASSSIPDLVPSVDLKDSVYRESDREYLSQSFLSTLSLVMIVGGWVWGTILIATGGIRPVLSRWWPPILLMVSGYYCHRFHEEHLSISVAMAVAGQMAACWLALVAYQRFEFIYGMVLPILVSGIIGGRWGVGGVVVASVSLLSMAQQRLGLAHEALYVPLFVVVAAGGIAWMLAQYIHVALDLSSQSRQRALSEMRKAQARRAELHRANRALDESNVRLQRLNHELLATRRQAEDARRLREEFAANVSHELRTPINLIVGFTEMMVTAPESYGGEALPSGYWGDVQAVHRSARHLQGLIDDILDLSRIDARQLELHRQDTPPTQLVHEACDVVRDLVERKGLELRMQVASGLPDIFVDRTRIRQVLLNLISNAVRFTDQGRITVSSRLANARDLIRGEGLANQSADTAGSPSRYVCIAVHDTGVGIKAEDMPKVFEKFRQLDGSPSRRHGGAGLGLAISKQFVELHGGWMWAESVQGEGSTFTFALPLMGANWSRPMSITTESLGDGPATRDVVLVVDTDPRSARLLQRHLPDLTIVGATEDAEIHSAMLTHVPDLVMVTDGRSPDTVWGGIPVDDPLRRAHVTVLAGNLSIDRGAPRGGWSDFMLKPVDREQLVQAIEQLKSPVHRVLVVEDEPDMARLISRLLVSWRDDLSVARAYSAQEVRQRLSDLAPDLILLDLGLPDVSGYDLLAWLRKDQASEVPVIVITGDADTEMTEAVCMTSISLSHQDGFRAQEFLRFVRTTARDFGSRYVPVRDQSRDHG